MKKAIVNRILPILLAFSISLSVVVPVRAVTFEVLAAAAAETAFTTIVSSLVSGLLDKALDALFGSEEDAYGQYGVAPVYVREGHAKVYPYDVVMAYLLRLQDPNDLGQYTKYSFVLHELWLMEEYSCIQILGVPSSSMVLADKDGYAILCETPAVEQDNVWCTYSSRKAALEGNTGLVNMKSYEDLYNLVQDEGGHVGSNSSLSSDGLSVTLTSSRLLSPSNGYSFSDASGFLLPCFYGYYIRADRESYSVDFIRDSYADDDVSSSEVVTLSLVDRDGNVYSCTGATKVTVAGSHIVLSSSAFDWGNIYFVYDFYYSGEDEDEEDYEFWYYVIQPNAGSSIDLIYAEIVPGSSANTGHEYVSGVTGIDRENLNTPTLAVRSDIDVTSYQIGGVRPSVPTKGQVWALVESGYITSLQIYNGRAWEGCDGRIWTGERWVP